jgi:hypothetical protein
VPGYDARRALLGGAALVFGRGDFAAAASRLDDQMVWLLGAAARARFAALLRDAPAAPRRTDFPEGGYRALGMTPPGRLRVLFDTGPLGYTRIAAHGHADALAVLLWLNDQPLLVDAGTYCYNDQPAWRAYFRGTAAHNTVRVDGADQSVPGGAFMWLRKAAVARLASTAASGESACAAHDGYRRLPDPVTHERLLELTPATLNVTDTLHCAGPHEVEICWHFAEQFDIAADARTLTAGSPAGAVRVSMQEGEGTWHLHRGQDDPPWGWRSPCFGVKLPITTAVWRARIMATTRFRTSFEPMIARSPDEPA